MTKRNLTSFFSIHSVPVAVAYPVTPARRTLALHAVFAATWTPAKSGTQHFVHGALRRICTRPALMHGSTIICIPDPLVPGVKISRACRLFE